MKDVICQTAYTGHVIKELAEPCDLNMQKKGGGYELGKELHLMSRKCMLLLNITLQISFVLPI